MRRKIIKQGQSYTLTLPKQWIEQVQLQEKDEVTIEEQDLKLIISTQTGPKPKKRVTLTFTNEDLLEIKPYRWIQRLYSIYYKQGIDEIIFKSKNQDILKYTEERTSNFIGFEVINRGKDFIEIKDVVGGASQEFPTILNRAFLIINILADESFALIEKKDFVQLAQLLNIEKTNGKLTDYCKRLLAKDNFPNHNQEKYYYALITENERLADQFKYIIEHITKNKVTLSPATKNAYQRINQLVHLFYESFCKYNPEKLKDIARERDVLTATLKDLMVKVPKKEIFITHCLLNITIALYEISEAHLEMNLPSN